MPAKKTIDIEDLRFLIEELRLRQWVVAQMMDVHTATIEVLCKKHRLKTNRTGPMSGENHPDWKGGLTISKGYRYVFSPKHPNKRKNNYVAEHRLVMEEKLGRYLHPKEVVHHLDGNPLNNHPDNLLIFGNNADHLRHELTGKVPNWTPEGKKKILAGVRRAKKKQSPTHRQSTHDGLEQPQTIPHQTS